MSQDPECPLSQEQALHVPIGHRFLVHPPCPGPGFPSQSKVLSSEIPELLWVLLTQESDQKLMHGEMTM